MNKISKLFLSAVCFSLAAIGTSSTVAATNTVKAYKGTGVVECVSSGSFQVISDNEAPFVGERLGQETRFDISYDGKNFLVTEVISIEDDGGFPWGPFKATLTAKNRQYTLSYCEYLSCDGPNMRITFPIKGGEAKVEEEADYIGSDKWDDYFNYDHTFERDIDGVHEIIHTESSGYCEFTPN